MTKEEAKKVNAVLLAAAKEKNYEENESDWRGKRCAVCGYYVREGDKYINFVPFDYSKTKVIDTPRMHVNCLAFRDRNKYPSTSHIARISKPLLTPEMIYDIILQNEKDTSDDNSSEENEV